MLNIKKVMISIVLGLVVFAVGGGVGVLYQQQKEAPATQAQSGTENSVLKILNSKVVSSIMASGKVTGIDGKNLVLTAENTSIKVKIMEETQISSFTSGDGVNKKTVQKNVRFEDIKVGDNLSVNFRLLKDGQIEAQSVIIFN